jgi:hypothetical protein
MCIYRLGWCSKSLESMAAAAQRAPEEGHEVVVAMTVAGEANVALATVEVAEMG